MRVILRVVSILWAAVALSGCAIRPLMGYNLDAPAQSLYVLGANPVVDGRQRFREIFCTLLQDVDKEAAGAEQCSEWLHYLSDEPRRETARSSLPEPNPRLRVVILPGLFSACISDYVDVFEHAAERLREKGYRVDRIDVGGRSSSRRNAEQIADYLRAAPPADGERLLLLGHSKGTVDILRFLVDFPELVDRVSAVASVAGAVNGSPLADWSAGTLKPWGGLVPKDWCAPGDDAALESLRRSTRLTWLASHRLPISVDYFSLVAFTERDRVAWPLLTGYDLLSFIEPRNDGQLLFYDQVIPGATLLGYANADHWSVALPVSAKAPWLSAGAANVRDFPRPVLLEAIVLFTAERLAGHELSI